MLELPYRRPKNWLVKLRRFEILTTSFQKIETEVVVEVNNRAAKAFQTSRGELSWLKGERSWMMRGTHLDESDLDAQFSGNRVTGTLIGNPAIAAQDKTLLRFPVTLELPKDPQSLEHVIGWERVLLEVKGQVNIEGKTFAFGGNVNSAYRFFPEITLLNPQVATVDGGKSGVAFFSSAHQEPEQL